MTRNCPIGKTIKENQFVLFFGLFQGFSKGVNILHFHVGLYGISIHALGKSAQSKKTYKI